MITSRDRIRGALLGNLVGDALGVPVEFMGRSKLDRDPVTGMRAFGTWNQPAGTWSDDGAMALATAEVLTAHDWNPGLMIEGFRRWLDEGWCTAHGGAFDIGNATRNAITMFRIHGDWTDCGQAHERDNGNGSLMRIAPASAWLVGSSAEERIQLAGQASGLTHAHIRSRMCCAWHALWCEAALGLGDHRHACAQASLRLRRELPPEERVVLGRLLDGTVMDLPRDSVQSDSYVVSTLEASVWCLAQHHAFADTVLAAVNLGGDTDTTGAVAGGMAGWLYGLEAIPAPWLHALPRYEELLDLADRFARRCEEHWSADPGTRQTATKF